MSSRRGRSRRAATTHSVARVRTSRRGLIIWVVAILLVLISGAAASGFDRPGQGHSRRCAALHAVLLGRARADRADRGGRRRRGGHGPHRHGARPAGSSRRRCTARSRFAALAFLVDPHRCSRSSRTGRRVIDAFVPFLAHAAHVLHRARHDRVGPCHPADRDRDRPRPLRRETAVDLAGHPRHGLPGLAAVDRARPARGPDGKALRGLELRGLPGGGRARSRRQACGHDPQPQREGSASGARPPLDGRPGSHARQRAARHA